MARHLLSFGCSLFFHSFINLPLQNMKPTKTLFALAASVFAASFSHGAVITLGGPLPDMRTATLSSAESGFTGSGNATAAVVSTTLGGTWTERGSIEGGSAGPGSLSDGMFNVVVSSGTWGSKGPISGTWTITNSSFFTTYADAAISLHVGNGGGEPDHFIWKLTPDLLTGTFSYDGNGIGGGGLSNLKLFSSGTGTPPPPGGGGKVPDGGTTLLSLGLALVGLGSMRKLVGGKG